MAAVSTTPEAKKCRTNNPLRLSRGKYPRVNEPKIATPCRHIQSNRTKPPTKHDWTKQRIFSSRREIKVNSSSVQPILRIVATRRWGTLRRFTAVSQPTGRRTRAAAFRPEQDREAWNRSGDPRHRDPVLILHQKRGSRAGWKRHTSTHRDHALRSQALLGTDLGQRCA